jgi:excinuclease ABC subunit C
MGQPTPARPGLREQVSRLPDRPGVYLFSDADGALLYVGKALSLRKRVGSYLRKLGLSPRIATMMQRVASLDVRETASPAEALLLEAELIKERRPYYNVTFRDDKRYPLLKLTREAFPRLVIVRRRANDGAVYFGPYTDAGLMREAVRYLRRVFPLRTCKAFPKTPCLEYHLGQCLAPCAGFISEAKYQRIVDDLAAFLGGARDRLLRDLSRRMQRAARDRRFEEAARLRDQMRSLTSVITAKEKSLAAGPLEQLQAALKLAAPPRRIEAFDISNIQGELAVGSMVVFTDGKPHKAHYRRFRIDTVAGIDDYAMMREVIRRRYSGSLAAALPLPDLILVDGGKGQLSAALKELGALSLRLPAIGLAKRFEHIMLPQTDQPVVLLPTSPVLHLVQHIRDEAHRFAITYHRRLRERGATASALDQVEGIGPARKRALLQKFGTVSAIARASPEELAQAAQLPRAVAETVRQHLNRAGNITKEDG